jgi:hypothetical protein
MEKKALSASLLHYFSTPTAENGQRIEQRRV